MTIYLTLCVLFEKVLLFSLLSIIYFSIVIVGVETLFHIMKGMGGATLHTAMPIEVNWSAFLDYWTKLESWHTTSITLMILEAGILERIWEQLSIYISIPYPLYTIATIFHGSLQMLLNLGLKLPFILTAFSALYHTIKKVSVVWKAPVTNYRCIWFLPLAEVYSYL